MERSTAAHSTAALYLPAAAPLAAPLRPPLTSSVPLLTSSWRVTRSHPSTSYEGRWRSRRGPGRRTGSAPPPRCRRLRGRAILRIVCETEKTIVYMWTTNDFKYRWGVMTVCVNFFSKIVLLNIYTFCTVSKRLWTFYVRFWTYWSCHFKDWI